MNRLAPAAAPACRRGGGPHPLVAVRLATAVRLVAGVLCGIASLVVLAPGVGAQRVASARPDGLRVVSVSPSPGASAANGAAPVVVEMSGLLAPRSPRPALRPPVAGRWTVDGQRFVFEPAGAFAPFTRVTLILPAAVTDRAGHRLGRRLSFAWSVAPLGILRAEQILAGLGDLPVHFVGTSRLARMALAKAVFQPPAGRFVWSWDAPATLRAAWVPGRPSVVLTGALMTLQSKLGLPVTGVLDEPTARALLAAAGDPGPAIEHLGYRYAYVTESSPEVFTLYDDGRVVLTSPANTGISLAPTTRGTYPVYLRFATQVMKGTEPDGQPYADPVAWVAYFDGGQAVHYIDRSYYGYPQSLGCVELPWDAAEQAWSLLTIGTLVSVAA